MTTYTGRLDINVTVIDALHHGAGTLGNTQMLRTQTVIQPDGTLAKAPFISGNSLKHKIRDGAVRFALEAMDLPPGRLSRGVINLLFSGGTLSKGGGSVDLSTGRELAELFPALSLCGYAAGNAMAASKLSIDNLHLLCAENAWRAPDRIPADSPHLALPAGRMRGEEFGTRHDATKLPHVRRHLAIEDQARQEQILATKRASKSATKSDDESAQMIYTFQVLHAGAKLFGAAHFDGLTARELTAFRAGLSYSCEGVQAGRYVYSLGAKRSAGWGRVSMEFRGHLRRIVDAPVYEPDDAALPTLLGGTDRTETDDAGLTAYVATLRERRDDIISILESLA